jgi:hypothetical protein
VDRVEVYRQWLAKSMGATLADVTTMPIPQMVAMSKTERRTPLGVANEWRAKNGLPPIMPRKRPSHGR